EVVGVGGLHAVRILEGQRVAVFVIGVDEIAVVRHPPEAVVGIAHRVGSPVDLGQTALGERYARVVVGEGGVQVVVRIIEEGEAVQGVVGAGDGHRPRVGLLHALAVLVVCIRRGAGDVRHLLGHEVAVRRGVGGRIALGVGHGGEVVLDVVGGALHGIAAARAAPGLGG